MKYIFITGGVVSSLGKGIIAASLGKLAQEQGLRVSITKMDPYLNVDAGTMNPFQHGEVFVTHDGAETDLDIGHYERFGIKCSGDNSITAGRIYQLVTGKERRGDYLGQTVQVIPHVTNEIKQAIKRASKDADISIVEIGGTVGDLEGLPFLEAIRQFGNEHESVFVHVTLLPMIHGAGEVKTKPTQHSVQKLREIGITPNVIVCRSDHGLTEEHRKKISMFCSVPEAGVFLSPTVNSVYDIPQILKDQGFDRYLLGKTVAAEVRPPTVTRNVSGIVVGLIGKYTEVRDAYKSVYESIEHAGRSLGIGSPTVVPVDSEDDFDPKDFDAIIVPGGFGSRGIAGKRRFIAHAIENDIPFLGICLGLQLAALEIMSRAGYSVFSEEHSDGTDPLIAMLDGQKGRQVGASMRLGAYRMRITDDYLRDVYGDSFAYERHRHRYEVSPTWLGRLQAAGVIICGQDSESGLVEAIRLPDKSFFVGCQYHPEFISTPDRPHPLFRKLVEVALEKSRLHNT